MGEYDLFTLIAFVLIIVVYIAVFCYTNLPTRWTLPNKELDYDFIKNCELISLKGRDMKPLPASALWENQRVLVMVVRRPGCILCRKEAKTLSFMKQGLNRANVKLVAVVHEKFDVEQFRLYFGGDIYLDKERRFYGQTQRWLPRWHSRLRLDTLYHKLKAMRAGIEGNSLGEGRLLGGVFLIGKGDDGILYRHYERSYGDMVNVYKVMNAIMSMAMP